MERKQITFYRSFFTAIRRIRRKADRCDAYDAIFDYAFSGIMPDLESLSDAAAIAFDLVKPNIDASNMKAAGGRKGRPAKDSEKIPEGCGEDTANEKEKEKEVEKEYECKEIYKEIISYLNEKTGKNYRHTSRRTCSAIRARLAEGFTVEDFKAVIDRKCADWLKDAKMEEYLRPETLFGTKFEGYLNAGGKHGNITGTAGEARVGHYL